MRPFVFYMRCISRIKLLGSGGCPDTVLVAKLHLTFLVAAQHQRMLRRRHIQADDFLKLLNKFRIARYLERLDQVRLETIGLPDVNFHPNGAKTFSAYWSHWICGVMEPVVFHRNGATLFSA